MEKRKNWTLSKRVSQRPDRKNNEDFIFGTRAIIEAFEAGKEIDKILVQRNLNSEHIKKIVSAAKAQNIPLSYVPIEKMNSVTRKIHQGVICYLSAITYASLDNIVSTCYEKGKSPFLVILDRITDVRNFGAIARTAACAGVDGIIIPSRGSAQITGDAMKTSAGALNYIPICREPNLKDTINYLKDNGVHVLACTEQTDTPLYTAEMDQPIAILMGSEEDGISPEYIKLASSSVQIPMTGKIASLNVSVATAVVVFEVVRQRQ